MNGWRPVFGRVPAAQVACPHERTQAGPMPAAGRSAISRAAR
jgi:hypothetical protein